MIYSTDTTYENYLYLRRQLGEPESGDSSHIVWGKLWPFQQKVIIRDILEKAHRMAHGRDLSWGHYCNVFPDHGERVFNPHEWEVAPLFVKAAIIKPTTESKFPTENFWFHDEPSDAPDTREVAW